MAVKIIKAKRQTTAISAAGVPAKLRVAAYARVSTDSADQEMSFESQCGYYTAFINNNPEWTMAGIYADSGLTGTTTIKRDAFNRLIADCEAGRIDMVITKSISRFARNTVDCLNAIRKLKALSIPVQFEKEAVNTMESKGEFLITILGSLAQQESESISQNITMGIEYRFREGKGRIPWGMLGYRKHGDEISIVPPEADLVRRIYREFLEGRSPQMIADRLNDDGVSTPRNGSAWRAGLIRSILSNEKYCGAMLLRKYYTPDFLTHKTVRNTGQREQYFEPDDHDPIVPKAIHAQVQGELKRRGALTTGQIRFGNRLGLNGRLACGYCGTNLRRYARDDEAATDWRCREKGRKAGKHCRNIKEQEVKGAVVEALNLVPEYRSELERLDAQMVSGQLFPRKSLLEKAEQRREELEARLDKLGAGEKKAPDGADDSREAVYLKQEAERVAAEIERLRCEHAMRSAEEIRVRFLLEFIAAVENSDVVRETEEAPSACTDPDDFYRRTAYHPGEGLVDCNGRVTKFDNDMVVRFVDRIAVFDEYLEVRFKAGITVRIER